VKKDFKKVLLIIITFIYLSLFILPVFAKEEPSQTFYQGEIVIYLNKDKTKAKKIAKEFKNVKKDLSDYGVLVVDSSEITRVKDKKAKKEIVSYGPNLSYKTFITPNDTFYADQWALPKISAPAGWDITTGSSDVVVAVIDTGFVLDHDDLVGKFVAGQNVIDENDDPYLPGGGGTRMDHGTVVAGVIAATTNNSKGITGVDWGAKIMPIRAFDNDGNSNTALIMSAVNYARSNGAKVINMSFGSDGNDPNLEVALNDAYNSGIALVAASGNDSRLGISYPAKYTNVIAVGSVNSSDIKASTSNYGPELDIVAPGVSILSTTTQWSESTGYAKNYYTNKSGTSLAAPHVSGLASLILSTGVYSPSQIKDKINSTADKVSGMNGENRTDYYGYGRINVSNSLSQAILLDHIEISPNTTQNLIIGQSINFVAQGKDFLGNDIADLNYSWVGTDNNGIFLATKTGIFNIRASVGSITSQSTTVNVSSPTSLLQASNPQIKDSNNANVSTPFIGQEITVSFSLTNHTQESISINGVGVAGRFGTLNRDLGWVQSDILPGASSEYIFQTTVRDLGVLSYSPSIYYGGQWYSYPGRSLQTRHPNMVASSLITVNPEKVTVGQSSTLAVTVTNNENVPLKYNNLVMAGRVNGSGNYDLLGSSDETIPAKSSKTISRVLTYSKAGTHSFWPSINIGNNWVNIPAGWNNLIKSWWVSSPTSLLQASNPQIKDSNNANVSTPFIGQEITVSFSLTNHTQESISINGVGVAGRFGTLNRDLGWVQSDILPGASSEYIFQTTVRDLGVLSYSPSIYYGGQWYSYPGRSLQTRHPNMVASSLITVNPEKVTVGQSSTLAVTVTNNENVPLKYNNLVMAGRVNGSGNYDLLGSSDETIPAKSSKTISRVLTYSKAGTHSFWPSINIGNNWVNIPAGWNNLIKSWWVG
jgi:hypothetical protein